MSGLNKVMLIGRLGQNPELKQTNGGAQVVSFSIATSEKWKNKDTGAPQEKTEWHRIVCWNKLAELAAEYLAKGSNVYIEGKLQTRQWEDKDGAKRYTTEIVAGSLQFLDKKKEGGAPADDADPFASSFDSNEEIPF